MASLQTVVVSKSRAPSRSEAAAIARKYANRMYTSRETENSWRFRQFDPDECSGGYYTVSPEAGVTLTYCDRRRGG